MAEHRLDLFPCAAGYLWLEGSDGSLIPLAGPSARHQGGLIGNIEKQLELTAKGQHGASEVTKGDGEVQGTRRSRIRGAGTFTEDVGLIPVSVADRAGAYLRVYGPSGHRPIFSMPTEIPQTTKCTYALPERLWAAQPGSGAYGLVRGGPNRGGSSAGPVSVAGRPVSQYTMMTQYRAEVTQGRGTIRTDPLPERWGSDW